MISCANDYIFRLMFMASAIPLKNHTDSNFAKILRHEFIAAINENCKPISFTDLRKTEIWSFAYFF